ncbi:hypothetical protein B0H10DRAFT_1958741 [Mycena sp. CBHHK59/15]|nr:hypothetical protein B0H10DRAFT_1958741 [Mycena sp. CBHHK59/15]
MQIPSSKICHLGLPGYSRLGGTRRKDHLKSARSALDRWRINTSLDVYGDTSLTPKVLLSDKFLTTLGSKRAKTLQELRDLVPDWAFADEHIPDIMRTLSQVDEQERAQLQRDKELRAADRVEKRQAKRAAENPNPQPRKRRGRPPKARVPLATTSANTISSLATPGRPVIPQTPMARAPTCPITSPATIYHSPNNITAICGT